jgi:hypothetical protein
VLAGSRATAANLFAQIRKRGQKSAVDVLILTHGMPGRLWLRAGDLTEAELRAEARFSRLRMVYMMGCHSSTLVDAWHAAGAQLAIGHQDVNSLSSFFFPRFVRRWAEGFSGLEAAKDAHRFAMGAARTLQTFRDDEDLLNMNGIARSEPILRGVDIDRAGRERPEAQLVVTGAPLAAPASRARPTYRHTDFERLSIGLLSASLPQSALRVDGIPTPQALLETLKGPAWSTLSDSFPFPGAGSGGPGVDENDLWVDGDALRYFLGGLRGWGGADLGQVLDRIQGARLTRLGDRLALAVYFDSAFELTLKSESAASNWELYAVHVPKTVRLRLGMTEGVVSLEGLDGGADSLKLRVKMPYLPNTVYLRRASANLTDGNLRVEAGVIGNTVTLLAKGKLEAQGVDGKIDIWGSIRRNLKFLSVPTLLFSGL